MADDNTEAAEKLGTAVPIAQLTPDTARSSTVNGIITIVWPFNKVENSVAFILAEPEFRLRRAKGQVRVNFSGSSAKAISGCGFGSSDKVQLSLEGAEFVPNTKARIPGSEVDWQLNFSERLLLHVELGDAGETRTIDVDHPTQLEPEADPVTPLPEVDAEQALLDLPSLPDLVNVTPIKNASLARLKDGEFESPAFVKRARISYGSLYEDDIFQEDGAIKGRGRKRTRFSLNPGSWRYSSKSPSPERPAADEDSISSGEDVRSSSSPRPHMTNSECQTMELDFPEPPPTGPSIEQRPFEADQPNSLLNAGAFVDQGDQTFPLEGWTAPIPELQQSFSDSGLYANGQSASQFIPTVQIGSGADSEHQPWTAPPLPNQSVAYPELPLDASQVPFAPSFEPPFDPAIANGFGGVPGIAQDDSFVHSNPFRPIGADDGSTHSTGNIETSHVHPIQAASVYPDLGTDTHAREIPAQQVLLDSPFAELGVPLAKKTVTAPANPFARETSVPSERAAMNAGTSSWAAVNNRTSRSVSRPSSSRLGSGDGQTPQSAMVIDESDSDGDENKPPLEDAVEADLGDAPVSLPEHAGRALAQAAQNTLIGGLPPGHDITEEDWDEELHAYADHSPDRYDDEYDEDEDGGDYDTSHYLAPQSDEDDGNDMDLRQHQLEPEFNDVEGESWDEDEGEEEFEEEDYDDDRGVAANAQQLPQGQFMRPASSAPVVIDLLSDSDDDDDESQPRPLPNTTMPAGRSLPLPSQPMRNSPDYGPGSVDESEEDEDELDQEELDSDQSGDDLNAPSHQIPEDDYSDADSDEAGSGLDAENVEDAEQESESSEEELDEFPTTTSHREIESSPNVDTLDQQIPTELALPPPSSPTRDSIQSDADEDMENPSAEENPTPEGQAHEAQETSGSSAQEEQLDHLSSVSNQGLTQNMSNENQVMGENPDVSLPMTEMLPKAKLDSKIAAPASPPPTQSFQSHVPDEDEGDIAMEEHLPTPLGTQLRESQDTDVVMMETDGVDEVTNLASKPQNLIVTGNTSEAAQTTVARVETIPTAEITAKEKPVSHRGEPTQISTHEDAMEVSQNLDSTITTPESAFESQVGGQDALRAALGAVSQPITEIREESPDYISDGVSEASSFVSQLDGDDALQAALREEDSRYFDHDSYEPTVEEDKSSLVDDDEKKEQIQATSRHSSPVAVDEEEQALPVLLPAQPGEPAAHASSPELRTTPIHHVNEAGIAIGSPEWTAIERHEHEEPSDLDSSAVLQADLATHKNEAGVAVGSPERAAIERHQPEHEEHQTHAAQSPRSIEAPPAKSKTDLEVAGPTTEQTVVEKEEQQQEEHSPKSSPVIQLAPEPRSIEADVSVGSPGRAAIERHQHDHREHLTKSPRSVRSTPVKITADSTVAMDSPERSAVERHQPEPEERAAKSLPAVESTPVKNMADSESFMGSPEKTAKRRSKTKEDDEVSILDPSVKLARAAIASKTGLRSQGATLETPRPQTRSKNLQKSPTPDITDDSVELAKASLRTPTKAGRADAQAPASSPASSRVEEEASSLTASKLKLVRHLRDELSEYTTLKVLRQHTGKSVEVMAVAMMTPPNPQRAKGGPREYMMSFTITDHSISPSSVAEVQLYRPHKDSLPKVTTGDIVLLRNFTVVSLKNKGYGLRTNEGSSWAVFEKQDEPAQIKGPPVEYGDAETTFATYLREWFGHVDEKAKQKLEKANQKIIEAGRAK